MPKVSYLAVALAMLTPAAAPAEPTAPAGDAQRGGRLFLQCRACHVTVSGAPGAVGPNLVGVVGAKAGKRAGYSYSAAMANSGLVWNAASLDTFLKRPNAAVPGTKMAFAGVADPKARADIIAYLTTLKAK